MYAIKETYRGFLCAINPILWERDATLENDIYFFDSKKETNKMIIDLRKQGCEVKRICFNDT